MGQTNSNKILNSNSSFENANNSSKVKDQLISSEDLLQHTKQAVAKVNQLFDKILFARQKTYQALSISEQKYKYSQHQWSVDNDFDTFKLQLQSLCISVPLENVEIINEYAFEISMSKITVVSQLCQINRLMDKILRHLRKNKCQKEIKIQLINSQKILNSSIQRLEKVLFEGFVCIFNADIFLKCLRSAPFKNQLQQINDENPEKDIQYVLNTEISYLSTNQSFDHNYLEEII